jgi:hypothetical protein
MPAYSAFNTPAVVVQKHQPIQDEETHGVVLPPWVGRRPPGPPSPPPPRRDPCPGACGATETLRGTYRIPVGPGEPAATLAAMTDQVTKAAKKKTSCPGLFCYCKNPTVVSTSNSATVVPGSYDSGARGVGGPPSSLPWVHVPELDVDPTMNYNVSITVNVMGICKEAISFSFLPVLA